MRHSIYLIIALLAIACGKSADNQTTEDGAAEETVECTYEVQPAFTNVNWTAYKFTSRAGVGGTFTSIDFTPGSESGSVEEILEGLSFSCDVTSTSTKDTSRDRKIKQYFFANMANTETIVGSISGVNGEDGKGTATVRIRMNEVESEVEANYQLNGKKLTLSTSVKMEDWNAVEYIDALNEVCYDLHTGEDGVSKLWPDIDIEISSVLKKNCGEDAVASASH